MGLSFAGRGRAWYAGVVVALGVSACADGPERVLAPEDVVSDEPEARAASVALRCAVDVRSGWMSCDEGASGGSGAAAGSPRAGVLALGASHAGVLAAPGELIVGGQGVLVRLESENVCYEDACVGGVEGSGVFQADVTVQNLMGQALASEDGATPHAEGVRVFFVGDVVVTSGTGAVTFANADGTATFTGSVQAYIQYGGEDGAGAARGELGADGILGAEEVSEPRSWRWSVAEGVESFAFQVLVRAVVADAAVLDKVLAEPGTIVAGANHVCALDEGGAAYCWGSHRWGQLGHGAESEGEGAGSAYPVPVAGGHTFVSLAAGVAHTCGLTGGGDIYCWGLAENGALGDGAEAAYEGDASEVYTPYPVKVAGGHVFTQVAAGDQFSCGLTLGGSAYCWGQNSGGQLGTGDHAEPEAEPIFEPTPVPVAGGHTFASLTAGYIHACGLTAEGTAYCWGRDNFGQLGVGRPLAGSAYIEPLPTAVVGGHTFQSLDAGVFVTCGLTTDGAPYCWGMNLSGQLANSSVMDLYVTEPVRAEGLDGRLAMILGSMALHSCSLSAGGALHCWGANSFGQVGMGEVNDVALTPALVDGGLSVSSAAIGASFSCAITTDGAAYCWGGSEHGELGNGQRGEGVLSAVPVRVQAPAGVVWKTSK